MRWWVDSNQKVGLRPPRLKTKRRPLEVGLSRSRAMSYMLVWIVAIITRRVYGKQYGDVCSYDSCLASGN